MCQPDTTELGARANVKPEVFDVIQDIARRRIVSRVLLYGSRARGTSQPRSDIDLAAEGGDVLNFSFDVDEQTPTLLRFDIVNLDTLGNTELRSDIARDGVVVYDLAQA